MAAPVGGVWAQKIGDFQPSNFENTVAGVQGALDYCEAGGGGTVIIDCGVNITVTSTSIKVPNRVRLIGLSEGGTSPTFTASATANVAAIVENKTQDGTQEYCWIERINVNGNKAAGAVATTGIRFKGIFANSSISDCVVTGVSGDGVYCEGATANSAYGPIKIDNMFVLTNGGHNIVLEGCAGGCHLSSITSERPGAGKSCIRFHNTGSSSSQGHTLHGIYMESTDNTCVGIELAGCCNTNVNTAWYNGGALAAVVKISSTAAGSDGAFGSSGHVLTNISGSGATKLIDDQVSGVSVVPANGNFCQIYVCPRQSGSVGAETYDGQIYGLQVNRTGFDITAAATITPGNGNLFTVNGATPITGITAALKDSGRIISLRFTGAPPISDGGNLKLNGGFTPGTDDTLTLISDGTNWYELGRANSGGDVTVGGTFTQHGWVSTASATDITLGTGNLFNITGNTTINRLLPMSNGRVIYLRFNADIILQDHGAAAGNIFLRGSVNFNARDQDCITLASDNTNWVEISRRIVGEKGTTPIASAATIAIPSYGEVFHVTGNTNITNGITVNPIDFGRTVVLIFDSTPTVSDTGTSKLNGNFVATADDTLTLKCDGTNWYEMARSPN